MQVKTAEFITSSSRPDQCPQGALPEYAFIGRSNVGKSSLINMLTGRKALAAISSTPGKTMLINHFLIDQSWYLVDLPGYGYAQRSKKAIEKLQRLIEGYILNREQLISLFVLVDSRLEPQKKDLEFIRFLGENGVPFGIIFTKADKPKPLVRRQNVDKFLATLQAEWEELPPHFVTSSATGLGREEVLKYIRDINRGLQQET